MLVITNTTGGQQSAMTYLIVFAAIAGIVLFVWLIDRLLPNKKHHTAAGNALMSAEVFFRPSREHIIEARERKEDVERDDSGDLPQTGPNS